ncbi:hypothetical protein ABK810_20835 [Enterobacter hormaechei]|uniref:hypothetical protein n=1 Tax=Enterobacter hormaechei TaxID=158836 RepID=UPI001BCD7C4B|nr:hypothetical protein [Enterobacter hormaechei]MCU3904716.1 hypothetical protein [Enterobacter hormaechei subsp. steigerwaltii]MCE1256925.1 hypothetical protein [Enterobacter hormaechei]MCE1288080.1 hypothetical protein [Enterobacter hormaechei]MDE7659680.1 hypothetical protein [Enterobacter hormaechei]MDX7106193.1 hypothetical protein [Enterobacter hormaechei]
MSELTKEWLLKTITELEEERDAVPGVVNEDAAMALAAMKLAMASLEAEPVCVIDQSNLDYLKSGSDADVWPASRAEMGDVLLYRSATPAPVSVPDAIHSQGEKSASDDYYALGWNACRAAMLKHSEPFIVTSDHRMMEMPQVEAINAVTAILQGADGTLTNECTIPVTQFKPVADLYGLTSPTGGETSFTFDAVEARDFIDGGWSCQEYVELGRFQEAMLQNGNSPAQSDCCPEQNYIAPAQDGNSPVIPDGLRLALSNAGIAAPESDEMLAATYEKHIQALVTWVKDRKPFKSAVIPDGWVLVPEEPTHEMLEAGDEQFGTYDVYRRMLASAPQQEA